MSKIGRKPIRLDGVKVEVKGNDVHYKGAITSGVHALPPFLKITINGDELSLTNEGGKDKVAQWGLHRALLFNAISGARKEFERNVEITGLGFKAEISGKKVVFSLGYTHKINLTLPDKVSLTVDKTGQKLLFKSSDKELLGSVVASVKGFRPTEPYKGTGIKYAGEHIIRKAGKTKSK